MSAKLERHQQNEGQSHEVFSCPLSRGRFKIHKIVPNHVADDHVGILNAAKVGDRDLDSQLRDARHLPSFAACDPDGPAADPGCVLDRIYYIG